ncbi:MAG: hypothetical protein ACXVLQ_16950 [Bacteriovorax sp.]
MSFELEKILYKKYEEGLLASLYLIQYDSKSTDPQAWADLFIKQLTPLADHPDVLKVHKDVKENEYKVDSKSIKEFLTFINYRPLKLKKKFIFLFDAHDLSVIVSNKLLKVFEELSAEYCLFLMVPDNASVLPTVLSRAVKLKIQSLKEDGFKSFDYAPVESPQELLAVFKQEKRDSQSDEKEFIEQRIERCLAQSAPSTESYLEFDELLSVLKNYETASAFNNSKLSRLSPFFP